MLLLTYNVRFLHFSLQYFLSMSLYCFILDYRYTRREPRGTLLKDAVPSPLTVRKLCSLPSPTISSARSTYTSAKPNSFSLVYRPRNARYYRQVVSNKTLRDSTKLLIYCMALWLKKDDVLLQTSIENMDFERSQMSHDASTHIGFWFVQEDEQSRVRDA